MSVVLVLSVQGGQWPGMGLRLLAGDPAFGECLEACDGHVREQLGWSVFDELHRPAAEFRLLSEPALAQPVVTSLQIALARLILARGIGVAAATGLSMGEVAAAHIVGALTLPDAMTVVCTQSRLAARGLPGVGMMAWVAAGADELADAGALTAEVHVAVALAPRLTVISGRAGTVESVLARLGAAGIACGAARLGDAYHSPDVAPLEEEFRAPLARIAGRPVQTPLYSSVTGARIAGEQLGADHWWAVMRRPATFLAAMRATLADGHRQFIEVGPHPVLAEPMRQTAAAAGCTVTITCTMERGVDDVTTFETSLQSAAGRVQSNLRSSPRRKAEP